MDEKLDIQKTLLFNILWIPMFGLVCYFCIIGISVAANMKEDPIIGLMALVFSLFFTLKMLAWVGHPTLYLKNNELLRNANERIKRRRK